MESTGLYLLMLLGLGIWLWQNTLRAREHALRAAREACQSRQLQLLDGTVTLQRITLRRPTNRLVTLQRTFQFAYSEDGLSRQTGFVITCGNHVTHVGL
ncbi:DUF3301 domain-containing protein [Thiogranum longum]